MAFIIRKTYRHFMHDSLYRNSIFLIANTAALAAFSLGFWAFAARTYSASDVGIVSAIITAVGLLATLSFFGFDYALIKFIPGSNRAESRTHTALNFTAILSVLSSIVYLALIPILIPKLGFLTSSLWWMLAFGILVIATTWNTITNSIFIAHRRTQYILIASIVFGVIRLPLLYFMKSYGYNGLLISQIIAMVFGVGLCFIFMRAQIGYKYRVNLSKKDLRRMGSYTFGTYVSNVSGGLPTAVLPTMILRILGGPSAAYYYIASMFPGLIYIVLTATSQSFFAEAASDGKQLDQSLRKTARLMCPLVFVGVAALTISGWELLSIFGKAYAERGYWMLFFFSITALPKIASYLFSTVLRVHGRIKPVVIVATIGTVIQISASYIGMRITTNLVTLGVAALLCEVFVACSYTGLFFYYKKHSALIT
ncbi:MAG TPA: oligosaccharide flippase family protein [Verrucomicrobiae bacterium]|jgi:O-antigen/teichoic acid export membrane protein|nr:oligosaccharide flippase family protein [Verrucomicrobiae bacterium]